MVLEPKAAPDPTLTVNVDIAVPPEGMLSGLGEKLENVTPDGTEPVIESVTGPA
jgi:hypothetical protein